MKTSIDFLRKAADFKVISSENFDYSFNEYRGGDFTDKHIPTKVFAYSVEWDMKFRWIDKGWGDYCYEYYSDSEPTLPTKILIEQSNSSMPQWTDTFEEIRFFGKLIFSQSDDWGRKSIIWLSGFEKELELCENEDEVLKKIKEIQNREYYLSSKAKLVDAGLSEIQIRKFFNCKTAGWKYEQLELKLRLINNSTYPRELFKELSEAASNAKFNKIAKNWGLDELCTFSHPRKTNYTRLMYGLK